MILRRKGYTVIIVLIPHLDVDVGRHRNGSKPTITIFSGINTHEPTVLGYLRYQGAMTHDDIRRWVAYTTPKEMILPRCAVRDMIEVEMVGKLHIEVFFLGTQGS